jgi:hypothetical protein
MPNAGHPDDQIVNLILRKLQQSDDSRSRNRPTQFVSRASGLTQSPKFLRDRTRKRKIGIS